MFGLRELIRIDSFQCGWQALPPYKQGLKGLSKRMSKTILKEKEQSMRESQSVLFSVVIGAKKHKLAKAVSGVLCAASVVLPQSSFAAVVELSGLNGLNGFVVNGIDSRDRAGISVSGVGDINGDGVDDLIIGASYADPNGISYAGESYVLFGREVEFCNGLAVNINLNFGEVPNGNSNVVLGTAGDDDIRGRAGNDTICGEGGNDFIHGNSGDDWIDGGGGVDNLRGGQGNDVLFTGSGATVGTTSIVFGGTGDDEINGGVDADDLRGGRGVDIINGDQGDDEITGNADADTISGGPGDDVLRGGQGDDTLLGESGDDFLSGGGGSLDTCDGGSGTGDLATASCETQVNIP